ncbi:hypothetical protein ACE1CA_21225 [Aerosakkonemataceae cyanobacterium BLCC-F167]|uniref:ATP synthase F0 subunit 8 n=1 Tax=Floridaenema evergladense BLCC-F167 TaxID=3153639 RepID=A0ABV4WPN4_9CYAN
MLTLWQLFCLLCDFGVMYVMPLRIKQKPSYYPKSITERSPSAFSLL